MDSTLAVALQGQTMESAGSGLGDGPTAPHPFAHRQNSNSASSITSTASLESENDDRLNRKHHRSNSAARPRHGSRHLPTRGPHGRVQIRNAPLRPSRQADVLPRRRRKLRHLPRPRLRRLLRLHHLPSSGSKPAPEASAKPKTTSSTASIWPPIRNSTPASAARR